MKATITIYLDNGTKHELSIDDALELRDKLNRLAPGQESAFERWLREPGDSNCPASELPPKGTFFVKEGV